MEVTSYLSKLKKAYSIWIDEPEEIYIHQRAANHSVEVPNAVDVCYYVNNEPGEATIIGTAGMSFLPLPITNKRVEIGYEFEGGSTPSQREEWARQLAELATIPFRDKFALETPMILSDLKIPPFFNMTHVMVVPWDYEYAVLLPELPWQVEILRLVALFADEAQLVQQLGYQRAAGHFLKTNFNDPQRQAKKQ
jgi:hypothetical protein